MRGITEERLRQLGQEVWRNDDSNEAVLELLDKIISECQELNQWQPIETAQKYGYIKIWDKGYGQVVVNWNNYYNCFTDPHGHKYLQATHWQELPDDPL